MNKFLNILSIPIRNEVKVIPIISAAGGVGKTTLSLMLSYVLSPHYNVLLIDMDPTAGLTLRMFGDLTYRRLLDERRTLMDMIRDFESKFNRYKGLHNLWEAGEEL